MECPVCKSKTRVEIDTHSDGFAKNLQECGNCEALWTTENNRNILIHGAIPHLAVNQ